MLKLEVQQRSEGLASKKICNVWLLIKSAMVALFINIMWCCFPQKPPTEDCCHSLTEALRSPSRAASSMAAAGFMVGQDTQKSTFFLLMSPWATRHCGLSVSELTSRLCLSCKPEMLQKLKQIIVCKCKWKQMFACSLETYVNFKLEAQFYFSS